MTKHINYFHDREHRELSNWTEIQEWVEEFPSPATFVEEDEVQERVWAFRGVNDACHCLEPSIEREAKSKSMGWAALEALATSEFKTRAGIHLPMSLVPEDALTWLAMMQHYSDAAA